MSFGADFERTIDAARKGDESALSALYAEVNPRLVRYLRSREPQDAEDLSSEVWIRIARQLPRFEGGEQQFWALVWTVCRRCLNDLWKSRRRRRTESVAWDDLDELTARHVVEPDNADDIVQRRIDAELLGRVRRVLPAEQAEVILLRVVAGCSVDEVADAIGKSPGAVRVIQHRALKRLAREFPVPVRPTSLSPTASVKPLPAPEGGLR